MTPSNGYWVAIARDSNFTTVVQAAYTDEPCYAPRSPLVDEGTLYYWQVIPTLNGGANYTPAAGLLGGFNGSPNFQHASVPPTPMQPVGGAAASGTVVFHWSPVPGAGQELHDRDRRGLVVQLRPRTPPRLTRPRRPRPHLPGRHDAVLARARQQRRQPGTCLVGHVDLRADAARAHRSRPPPPFLGATFPALTWTPVNGATGYEIQNVWPDGSAPYHDRPECGGQLHQDDRHGTRQRAGPRALREVPRAPTRRRATSSTRSPSRAAPRRS